MPSPNSHKKRSLSKFADQSGEICEHRATTYDILIYSLSMMVLKNVHHQLYVSAGLAASPL